ncbi:hypothetical protein J2T57_002571 [Natronocella acetinitrilica]|uniref:DUF4426 domain-containing protein n=1 Tax=Natronocella acetinitrilica TaxID=414046 RepID=A0AAE3G443_9GAMM|nr:DUF4426 domain-containing protein [Natronocella acetinitrilica]MCP1675421.1 hypothetical protein [Natronocella acetinitrilica]
MNIVQGNTVHNVALSVVMLVGLAGCDGTEQVDNSAETQESVEQSAGDQQPLGHVVEFDDFTVQANVVRAHVLPEAMTQRYGIEPESDLVLLNLVVLDNRQDQAAVPADLTVKHENLSGHGETIDMRAVEADGHVSYFGTVDASGQRNFEFIIEAQPEGADEPLHMTFNVQLEAFELDED